MTTRYMTSPYSYGPCNNPTSWGVFDTAANAWTFHLPMQQKKDVDDIVDFLNWPRTTMGRAVDVLYLDGDYAETGMLETDTKDLFSVIHADGTREWFEKLEYTYREKR